MQKSYLTNIIENENLLTNQFLLLPQDMTTKNYATAISFLNKNNFTNILACTETMVRLPDSYINANYVLDKYIATQQPNQYSVADFWNMVYQEDSHLIINLNDNSNTYFLCGAGRELDTGILTVKTLKEKNNGYAVIRNMAITDRENNTKNVYHVSVLSWPDFSVPDENNFNKVLDIIKLIDYKTPSRIIVHCRAGIGRSGTFILIHYLYRMFEQNIYPDIIQTIKNMRASRIGMIQNEHQFKFVVNFIKKELGQRTIVPPPPSLKRSFG